MPPRKRTASSESPSYDGVPMVNVTVGTEPEPVQADPVTELDVVKVPAVDDTADPAGDAQDEE